MSDGGSAVAAGAQGRARDWLSTALASMLAVAALSLPAVAPAIYETTASIRGATGLGWYSSNWAGYAVERGPYRSVSGQWTVPRVVPTSRPTFSALWVGIDGVANTSLIQAGTEQDFYRGVAHYSAWWEVLPAPAVTIRSLAVRPGDRMTARIARVGTDRWRITISDARGGSYTTVRAYAGPGTSAEWIEEAPVVGWRTAALAIHGSTAFDNATVNGTGPRLIAADGGAMISGDLLVDVPSWPDRDGNGFALSQQGTAPAPPVS